MSTETLYKTEKVETLRKILADRFLLNVENVWLDGNVFYSAKQERKTKFPLKFHLKFHKDTRSGFFPSLTKKLTGYSIIHDMSLQNFFEYDNHIVLDISLSQYDCENILAKAKTPKSVSRGKSYREISKVI